MNLLFAEEVAPCPAGFCSVVYLVVDILKDALLRRPGAGEGELCRCSSFGLRLGIDLINAGPGDHPLLEELVLLHWYSQILH